jgi:co-chaperonin GroES (HSP10)
VRGAQVVSVGDTVEMEGVVKGAKLLIAGYGGMAVKLDDEQLFFIKDQDIMGVVSE